MLDVGAPELLVLVVIAVIVFGPEKLPEFARKAARVINYVRGIAGNAQNQLKQELGPGFDDVDFRDLNPKAFIQKHLLEDVDPIMADVKKEITSATALTGAAAATLHNGVHGKSDDTDDEAYDDDGTLMSTVSAYRSPTPFDTDAT